MGANKSTIRDPSDNQDQIIISHPKFSQAKTYQSQNEENSYIQLMIKMASEPQFKKWEHKAKDVIKSEYVFCPFKRDFEKTEFCGSGGVANLRFEFYPYVLEDEILNRQEMNGKVFEEQELWYLAFSLIKACSCYHTRNSKLGDVRPTNVFINPNGQVKVAGRDSWPNEETNYFKHTYEKENTYLSPEELKSAQMGKPEPENPLHESFSIGLTLLDASLLEFSNDLYQKNYKFNYTLLEEKLTRLYRQTEFSEPLKLMIESLCNVQLEKRSKCEDLVYWMSKYEPYIVELEAFQVGEIPSNLQKIKIERDAKLGEYTERSRGEPEMHHHHQQSQQYHHQQQQNQHNQHNQQVRSPPHQHIIYQQPPPHLQQQLPPHIQQQQVPHPPPPQVMMQPQQMMSPQQFHIQQNPSSILTFQKQNRSNLIMQPQNNRHIATHLDQQVEMSRKLFPN